MMATDMIYLRETRLVRRLAKMIDGEIDSDAKIKKIIKVLVVGECGTGKTATIRQYVHHCFTEFYKSTIGVDFAHVDIEWDNNLVINLQLWDISGEERFSNVTHMYYQEAVGAIIVFDVTNLKTLEAVKIWKHDIDQKVFTSDNNNLPCLLIGNKIDLISEFWGKTKEEMDQFCDENGFIGFFETSAKNGTNVSDSIAYIIKYIVENDIQPPIVPPKINLSGDNSIGTRKKECC